MRHAWLGSDNVIKSRSSDQFLWSSRMGTLVANTYDLVRIFGEPTYDKIGEAENGEVNILKDLEGNQWLNDRVTVGWLFHTPRGMFEVRDYWWNPKGTWSIAARNRKELLWALAYLKSLGFKPTRQC